MTIEEIEKNASFLFHCRENYFAGIRPCDLNVRSTHGYKNLVEIARLYFANNLIDSFAGHLENGHYFIQLWAAHLIIEYGHPDTELKNLCLEEIKKYCNNPLAPDVAIQEQKWLENYNATAI
jgi:hypothetical protein